VLRSELPVPGVVRPLIRSVYRVGVVVSELSQLCFKWFVVAPVVRSIASVGKGLRIERIPYVRGKGQIVLGDDVYISGKMDVGFARRTEWVPQLLVGKGTFIGHGCSFGISREVRIGDQCLLAGNVRMMDSDGHPLDAELRRAGEPVAASDIAPIVIENGAWVGSGVIILKGVRIGQNAVVGAGSVVTRDVEANTVAAGNPAKTVRRLG
jgi:acetyltransferase-like isoleucine patch superfamily enzyme